VTAVAQEAKRTPEWFPGLPQALEKALQRYDPKEHGDLKELDAMATQVALGGMSVHPEFSMVSDGCWIAPGSIYVTLVYEPDSKDRTEFTDSFPIRVYYTVANQNVQIEKLEVDVSSFQD